MKIIDTKLNKVGLGSDSTKETIGIVFKTSEELENRPLLGLIIPKFMLGYEFKDGDKAEDKTIENKTSNSISIFTNISINSLYLFFNCSNFGISCFNISINCLNISINCLNISIN